jgi:serine phosphatase RsbU (regulator of sigma subunit)
MALTEGVQEIVRYGFAKAAKQEAAGLKQVVAEPASQTSGKNRADNMQSVKRELDELRREHEKLQQAVFEAAQVQRRLCAPRELAWGEFEIAGEIFPVRHLSGDFFKVMELGSTLGLAVGDIAGKGFTAGIWQAHLMGLLQRCARRHSNPAQVLGEVNHELCQDRAEAPLTALFFARLDSATNELVFCNAGLPAPLLLRNDRAIEQLETGGPMLGAVPDATFESGSVRLNPGDMLIAYSDGVTECRNPQEEEFEVTRLSAAARVVAGARANQALFSTLGAVLDFADTCPPGDDLTLLVVRRRQEGAAEKAPSRPKEFSAPHRRPTPAVRPKDAAEKGHSSE